MKTNRTLTLVAGFAGMLLLAGLAHWLLNQSRSTPPNQTRIEERLRNLAEVRATNDFILNEYAWQNKAKGIVRVPIVRAKELMLSEWQNPAVGRSNLLARAAKAFAPLPKPPEVPNPYE